MNYEYTEILPLAVILYIVTVWGYWWVYKKDKK